MDRSKFTIREGIKKGTLWFSYLIGFRWFPIFVFFYITIISNLATVIIRQGTLRIGDYVIAGTSWAKVKGMTDDRGNTVTSAGPSIPVEIVGWKNLPVVGDLMLACDSEVG